MSFAIKKSYKADLGRLNFIVADLEDFCAQNKLSAEILFALNLSVEEIFSNIANYAYDGKDGDVEIEMLMDFGRAKLIFRDKGKAFDPLSEAENPDLNSPLEERKVGGLGIFFVKKQMDAVLYEFKNGHNELTIIKKC